MKSLLQDVIVRNNHGYVEMLVKSIRAITFHVHKSIAILEEFGINLWILSRGCFSVISHRISLLS
jgi:hypothetical protein